MKPSKFAGLAEIGVKNGKTARPTVGMRSNPDYAQYTFYIRKNLHHNVYSRLYGNHDGMTFSLLLEQLLEAWLEEQKEAR